MSERPPEDEYGLEGEGRGNIRQYASQWPRGGANSLAAAEKGWTEA